MDGFKDSDIPYEGYDNFTLLAPVDNENVVHITLAQYNELGYLIDTNAANSVVCKNSKVRFYLNNKFQFINNVFITYFNN